MFSVKAEVRSICTWADLDFREDSWPHEIALLISWHANASSIKLQLWGGGGGGVKGGEVTSAVRAGHELHQHLGSLVNTTLYDIANTLLGLRGDEGSQVCPRLVASIDLQGRGKEGRGRTRGGAGRGGAGLGVGQGGAGQD